MKFYNIGRTNEIRVIGNYPQTSRLDRYPVYADDYANKVQYDSFPNFQPKYGLVLSDKSIETDLLDRASLDFGMVVSERFKSLLERCILPPNKFYPIEVAGSTKRYYWFHYIANFEQYVNFSKTEIEVYKSLPPFDVEERLSLPYNKIVQLSKELVTKRGKSIRYSQISLKEDFPNYDIFEITGAQHFTLISERLKEELIRQNITGLEIVEYNKINKAV